MRKKLIEVAMPLDAINKAAIREKSIRHGHPSTLHLWWARRPLAACRAVLFCSLVDDPDQEDVPQDLLDRIDQLPLPDPLPVDWGDRRLAEQRRERLFAFITKLVQWENSTNEDILTIARDLIYAATGGDPPPVLDPFCGGGSIPLEAQRLGLEAHASDLNPVAVLITKALIQIPPSFANQPPVNPEDRKRGMGADWKGAAGLAADVRHYGKWMRDEAKRRIGHLYPQVKLAEGSEATVIAWLCTKRTRKAWVEPSVDRGRGEITFEVRRGQGSARTGTVSRQGAACLVCGTPVPFDYVRAEGRAKRLGQQLMASVVEGPQGRLYLSPTESDVRTASAAVPADPPDVAMPHNPFSVRPPIYGFETFADIFTNRQLVALETLSSLIPLAFARVARDSGDEGYAGAVSTYLALSVSKQANRSSTLCFWDTEGEKIQQVFARQAMQVTWDFVEGNPFSDSTGNFLGQVEYLVDVVDRLGIGRPGSVRQQDATALPPTDRCFAIATDPPYYDNIDYADLSDFFYVWLRRTLRTVSPELFQTVLVPKKEELVATPYRFGGDKRRAHEFFERGLAQAFAGMRACQSTEYPLTLFYAFKQVEESRIEDTPRDDELAVTSTGWEVMLESLIQSGLMITGTWPIRTEFERGLKRRMNALASSVVLVCRPRPADAPLATRRDFLTALKRELPQALRDLRHENIAPVDLAQAAIGPGMAVYSRYREIQDPRGRRLAVKSALQLINETLDEALGEGDYDSDTRWAVTWFSQHGLREGPFDDANKLANARATSVGGLEDAGIVRARSGFVRLVKADELPADWDPARDDRFTVWETIHHLIRVFEGSGGEEPTAELLAKTLARRSDVGELVRELAYQLFIIGDRKGWTAEARSYNDLVVAWPSISRLAADRPTAQPQGRMF